MKPFSSVRLVLAAALAWCLGSAVTPPTAWATARPIALSYQAAQPTPVPFVMPGAPGEAASPHDTGAGESSRVTEGAAEDTGITREIPPEFLENQ